mmetsp:Transcript_39066/g.125605  ORF Transcript_39066/g.125605 Transcript_39066/m.125605 type:complete len:324 (-) Transcript_39066:146-1117(-)
MRGLLERAREKAREKGKAVLDRGGTGSGTDTSASVGPLPAFAACAVGISSQARLNAALRKVTHSDCAAVPREDLQEVLKIVAGSEDALATTLHHIEESSAAPPQDWRRIHGALQLLEGMLRRRDPVDDALVGRVWFEVKMQNRLEALTSFEYADDRRVSMVVRRSATTVLNAARQGILREEGSDDEGAARSAARPVAVAPAASRGPAIRPPADVIGRSEEQPRGGPTTRSESRPNGRSQERRPIVVSLPPDSHDVAARGDRDTAAPAFAGADGDSAACRCCRWLRPARPATVPRPPTVPVGAGSPLSTREPSADEGDLLLPVG